MAHRTLLALAVLAAAACATSAKDSATADDTTASSPAIDSAAHAITAEALLGQIKDLSADSMEGRAPGTPGEDKTVAYLTRQFQALGLEPGNPDGTWTQRVDLIGYTSRPVATITAGGKPIPLQFPDDFVANSRHNRAETKIDNSDIVFVG